MTTDYVRRRAARAAILMCVFYAGFDAAQCTAAASTTGGSTSSLADGFAQLGENAQETRTVTLRELGLLESVTLTAPDTRREFFLPVPADVPITGATLQFDGAYVRGDGGRTTMLLSLDGSAVMARSFTDAQGGVSVNLGVDGAPRAAGFVQLGLGYASVINDNVCTDQTAIGNVLRVDPTTRLTYRFNPADVQDLRTAWSALPYAPVLTIAARRLPAASFDTAWRSDALLQRDGKRPSMQALPAVGERIDLRDVQVPAALRGVPAFAALVTAANNGEAGREAGGAQSDKQGDAQGDAHVDKPNNAQGDEHIDKQGNEHRAAQPAIPHVIANPAELGALIALAPRAVFGPDVVVADAGMRNAINAALDALRVQVAATDSNAAAAFDAWRARSANQIAGPLARGEVRVAHLGGRAVIVLGDNEGASVLARGWRPIDVSNRVVVHQIDPAARTRSDRIPLADLGGEPRSIDVHATAAWQASFDLAAASGDGQLPSEVVLDLAASPTLSNGGATATVYFNDVMIGAKLLDGDGSRQRLVLPIPRYALARTNELRVNFRRQPDAGCAARQTYPVAVLPGSYLQLASGTPDDDFVGMAARYASSATVIVPHAYLDDALNSVPRIATLTGAAGVAPLQAKFSVVENGAAAQPDGPFLAADVALADEKNHVAFSPDRLMLSSTAGDKLIDVSGLNRVAVLSVATSGEQSGIVYRSAGTTGSAGSADNAPVLTDKLQLSRGDIAVVDASGVLKHFDTVHPDDLSASGPSSTEWVTRHWARWGIPGVLLVLLVLLILLAGRARRKERKEKEKDNKEHNAP